MDERNMYEYERELAGEKRPFCGVDEAGRGPLAGPVCAAAVILPEGLEIPGLNDSKKLTEKKREELFDLICEQAESFAIAFATVEEIEELIKSCGLFRGKARNIKDASIMLRNEFGGELPREMDDLLRLPGVGRKIANLLRGDVFGLPAVVADTHCIRICGRLGFYPETLKDPVKVEKTLAKILPPEKQSDFCHRIVQFGRDVCMARSPRCEECELRGMCAHCQKANK